MAKRGRFIVFEGNDGGGKTTQSMRLIEFLREQGFDAVWTKQPGGLPETHPLRQLVLDNRLNQDGHAQLLLFAADRRLHLMLMVIPALEEGKIIVSDRYYGSTRVYQEDRGVNKKDIILLENLAITFRGQRLEPDITILLDVEPGVGKKRKNVQGEQNYFDVDRNEHFQKRREKYLRLAELFNWNVVDANRSEDEVFSDILTILDQKSILSRNET